MMRSLAVVASVVIVLSGPVRPAFADETCPGCLGGGKVGCPACAGAFGIFFIGSCGRCQGFYGWMHKGRCTLCYDTGKCHQCKGQGMACMVCKGSGRVADGTAAAIAKREKEANLAAMKRLAFFEGSWKSKGTEGEKQITAEYRWEKCVEGACLRLTERSREDEEKVTDLAGMLTYDPKQQCYLLLVFFQLGGSVRLTGKMNEKGDALVWSTWNNSGREIRITWRLKPGQKRYDYTVELQGDEGYQQTGEGSGQRTGDASDFTIPDADLKESLQPLGFLVGSWTGEEMDDKGKKTCSSRSRWEPVAGGAWLRSSVEFSRTDGTSGEAVDMLGYDAGTKTYYDYMFFAPGRILVFKGTAGEEEGVFEFKGHGLRWTMKSIPDEKRCDGTVEVDQGDGKWKLVSRSKSTRADR